MGCHFLLRGSSQPHEVGIISVPLFRIHGEVGYHTTSNSKRSWSLDVTAGLGGQTSPHPHPDLSANTLPHSLHPQMRRRGLRGVKRLTVHPNREPTKRSTDSNPHRTLNSSHKQLPVFTEPLAQFVTLSPVSSPCPPGKSG